MTDESVGGLDAVSGLVVLAMLACSALLVWLLPPGLRLVSLSVTALVGAYLVATVRRPGWVERLGRRRGHPPVWIGAAFVVAVGGLVLAAVYTAPSVSSLVLGSVVVFVFCYVWVLVPLAIYDRAVRGGSADPGPPYPSVSVVIPAYNEEGYVGGCVESVLAADYPADRIEVIVVDDGSTDDTSCEARRFATSDVRVVEKRNGGKYSALNYGLVYATGEIVVTVDADSRIDPGALTALVGVFRANPEVGAVAGTVRVANRTNLLTDCQALEYLLGIETYRRLFDLVDAVPIAPGCLGAYRRSVLEDAGEYDPDTLTEDFDATVKTLKAGATVRASEALVLTEGPASLRDLYRQRLRWYRGNAMTLLKHREVLVDDRFGALHRLVFPFYLLSMVFVPLAGFLALGAVVVGVLAGRGVELLAMLGLFTVLQALVAALAVRFEDDDLRLVLYAPLLLFGYKQFLDLVTLKGFLDVLLGGRLDWTSADRVDQPTDGAAPDR